MILLSNTFPVVGNGLGGLPDAIECVVSHEINGIYELQMRYPVTGQHFDEIESGRFIMAKPDDLTPAQPFRVYRITKPLNGVVTVYARHICYDMQGIVAEPFTAGSLTEAFQTLPTVLTPANSFSFQTTRSVASGITLAEPRPLWKLLGGQAGSFLDVYGGEWDFDGYNVKLMTRLGTDRGVTIRYGKNMTDLEQDATIEAAYSGVYPYWYDEESNTLVTLPEKFVAVSGAVVSDRVMMLDCSGDFDDAPTEAQLRARANAYITANSVGNAKTSWKISFVSSNGYEDDLRLLEQVQLGDTLSVYYERLNVNATARAVKTEYDVLAEHYKAVTLGRVKQNLAQIIVSNQEQTASQFSEVKSDIEHAVDGATDFIRHGEGYMRFIYNAADELTEIVSLDDPDITQAQKVWRWNNGGFGFSSTGYNGPYTLAITQNGAIVADFITAGTLNANVIRAGILQDVLGKNSWNLDTGALNITNGKIVATFTRTFSHSDYDNSDLTAIQALVSSGVWTDEDLEKYDINIDGQITSSDLVKVRNMILNGTDEEVTIRTEIDPSKTSRPIAIYNGDTLKASMSPSNVNAQSGTFKSKVYGGNSWLGGNGVLELNSSYGRMTAQPGVGIQFFNTSENPVTQLDQSGLKFYDSSGNEKTVYDPAYQEVGGTTSVGTGWTLCKTLTLTPGLWIVNAGLSYYKSAPRGVAIVGKASSSSTDYNLAVNESYASITGSTVSWIWCGTPVRITGTETWQVRMYAKSANAATNRVYMSAMRIA